MNPLVFLALLNATEQQKPAILVWLLRQLQADTGGKVLFRELIAGLPDLVANGVITQARADQITAAIQARKPAALSVTASIVNADHAQKDGRFWAYENHTLSDGSVQQFASLLAPGTDYNAIMAQRAVSLNAQLAQDAAAS